MKHIQEYRDPKLVKALADKVADLKPGPLRLMEVCGTHTMSIFRHGLRTLLPDTIQLVSGPGCPVCVTPTGEIDALVDLAHQPGVCLTVFGDLVRVPGSKTSLSHARAAGADVRVVYSASDALDLCEKNMDKKIVFAGLGFETTAPGAAACLMSAKKEGLDNFFMISSHRRLIPALKALFSLPRIEVDGLLLPGHVSAILGMDAYAGLAQNLGVPMVAAGFEPTDILWAVYLLCLQIKNRETRLENAYSRAVAPEGNPMARDMLDRVFEPETIAWRALGDIPESGMAIRDDFSEHDARKYFKIEIKQAPDPPGCACPDILLGVKTPVECPLFETRCTPQNPVGPCMVSSEGACAAFFTYGPKKSG